MVERSWERTPPRPSASSWTSTTVANGSHTLYAKAYDAAGNIGTSSTVSVTVSNDTQAPTVSMTSPANGSTVSGTAVVVSASASDNVGVARVEFYRDGGVLLATDTAAPFSISWTSTTVANGSHTLYVKAYDAAGNMATSSTVSVTVSTTTRRRRHR